MNIIRSSCLCRIAFEYIKDFKDVIGLLHVRTSTYSFLSPVLIKKDLLVMTLKGLSREMDLAFMTFMISFRPK